MNHRLNAKLHRYPVCPECNAFESCPCVSPTGNAREPHRIRQRLADGELFVISRDAAKKNRLVRLLVAIGSDL